MAAEDTGDRALGMDRPIPRRDVLGGLALLGAGPPEAAAQDRPGYDPPSLHGLRGSHPGSFEAAHSLRDGAFRDAAASIEDFDVVRSGRGRRRHQRPGGGVFPSRGAARRRGC